MTGELPDMSQEMLQWLVGIAVTITLGWVTILVGAFRSVMSVVRDNEDRSKSRDDDLHTRINRVREDTVYKTDLTEISIRLSQDMREMRAEHQNAANATNKRLDALMVAIANRNVNADRNHGNDN